jgi:hypothetical protein
VNGMRTAGTLALLCLQALHGAPLASAAATRTYELYEPSVQWVTIYHGELGEGHYGYNHMASLAYFGGRFHAAWGANPTTIGEGKPGQRVVLSTSEDFLAWTTPVHFVGEGAENGVTGTDIRQWQPNLLNYEDRELWCLWYSSTTDGDRERDGTYLSKLSAEPGAKWVNRRLFYRLPVDGEPFVAFPSQNPYVCQSGRVLAPVALYRRFPDKEDRVQWNACLYTDDGGETWECSNPIGRVDDYGAQWEPFFLEQAHGRLRAFMRNLTRATPPCTQWQLTSTGTGAAKGEPVAFGPDPWYSHIETANSRVHVLRLTGGRYCMFHHDVWVDHRDYSTRLNLALFFSRMGADDFVAGPPFSQRGAISAYPQGIEHDGKLYVAYTVGPGSEARSIEGAIIAPVPSADRYYIWPRQKDCLRMATETDDRGRKRVVRTNPEYYPDRPVTVGEDGRRALLFRRAASAGVDTDPIDVAGGERLTLAFEVKVRELQERGNLILCSFGDVLPIRLGVPSSRPGRLYAYAGGRPHDLGPLAKGEWTGIEVTFAADTFAVTIQGREPKTLPSPVSRANPRLYLGDGYEVDCVRSNWGSEFLIGLESIRTRVSSR